METLENPFTGKEDLPEVPMPEIPKTEFLLNRAISLSKRLASCQNAIDALEYNFTGTGFFSRNKFRPLNRILATGREILTTGLPIQCVEAVFAAIYLTQQMEEIERIPLSFKSRFVNGRTYQHIVCATWDPKRNKWGGLGLSRRKELGFKPLKFPSFWDLIMDYIKGYGKHSHFVRRIRVGIPVSHDHLSLQPICWRFLRIPLTRISHDIVSESLRKYQESCLKLKTRWEEDALEDMALGKVLGDLVSHFKRNCEGEQRPSKKRVRRRRKKPQSQPQDKCQPRIEDRKEKKKGERKSTDEDENAGSSEDLSEYVDEVHSESMFSDPDSESGSEDYEDDS